MRYAVADGFTAGAIGGLAPMLEDVIATGATALAPGSDSQLALDEVIDISPLLPAIGSPTLVIGAEDDRWVDVSHSRALASSIAGARFEALPAGLRLLDVMELSLEAVRTAVMRHTLAGHPPDVLITVPRSSCRTLDFHKAEEMIGLGRLLAVEALDQEEDPSPTCAAGGRP